MTKLPPRPPSFHGLVDYINPMPADQKPKGSLRNTEYLGSVTWSWGSTNSRRDSYYLNPRRQYWLLWIRDEDDFGKLEWILYAYGPKKGVTAKEAAVYLLMDAWNAERQHEADLDLDRYHWFYPRRDKPGLLSEEDFSAIAQTVWPDVKD